MTDFSASEDEWKPTDKNDKTEESTEEDITEDEEGTQLLKMDNSNQYENLISNYFIHSIFRVWK